MKKQGLLTLTVLSLVLSIAACNQGQVSSSSSSSSIKDSSAFSSETSEPISSSSLESSSSSLESSSSSDSSNPSECKDHVFKETTRPASIIEKGATIRTCEKCGYVEESNYSYDLNEFAFNDKTYLYDGNERELLIEGLIPYGTTVRYENNKLTEIGSKVATANIYDENNQLLVSKTATINIIENIGLPNIKVTTSTGKDPDYHDKTNYTTMTTVVDNCESQYVISGATGGIRARGNSTNYDVVSKHPWRLKFDSKVNLLGLNEGKKFKSWVLLAEYFDQSLLRNSLVFTMGNSLFNYSNNYCSDFKHVNFYMNGDYRGVYLLAEQQQCNTGRFGIAEPENGSSEKVGYLVEIDIRGGDDDPYFTCGPQSYRNPQGVWSGGIFINGVRVVSSTYAIKSDTFNEAQEKYIEKYISNAMDALIHCVTGEKLQVINDNNELVDSPYDNQFDTLNSFMDIESFLKICVIHELMKSYDVGFGSFYLFVDFSKNSTHKRLTFGAPWDFDLSSGNKQSGNINKTDNEFIKAGFGEANFNPWLYLISQTDFYDELIKKYYSVFANSGAFESAINYLDYATSAFETDFVNEFVRWKDGSGKERMQTRQYTSQKDASSYLSNWLKKRKQYMDSVYLR